MNYTWDDKGNLTDDGYYEYTYNAANRLTNANVSGLSIENDFAYNGLGDRLQQTITLGPTHPPTNYTLDLAGGLTQVLADSDENTYLYGVGRIGEEGDNGWVYYLGDTLGTVHQLIDTNGTVTMTQRYEPFGDVRKSIGSVSTNYGFTGEWEDSTGLIHLRARYYSPVVGRFISRDEWGGDNNRPITLNNFLYAASNPIMFIDPSGNILDPSDPTQRGTIIHRMIQAQYVALFSYGGQVGTEVVIPSGSTKPLSKIFGEVRDVSIDNGKRLWSSHRTNTIGVADIIDTYELGLYEIKPHSGSSLGVLTVGWYLAAYNSSGRGPYLNPGAKYPRPPGTIVGTDPKYPSKWIIAELYELGGAPTGVILYGSSNKDKNRPVPVYVFEWDHFEQKAKQRKGSDVLEGLPAPSGLITLPSLNQIGRAGLVTVCASATLYLGWKLGQALVCGPCVLVFP